MDNKVIESKYAQRCPNTEHHHQLSLVCCVLVWPVVAAMCKEREERGEGATRTAFSRLHLIVKMQ